MMRLFAQSIVLIALSVPQLLLAVEFTEVAWMGGVDSANHEWIELYATETIDVTDWTISDERSFSVVLNGVLQAGEYSVLERTSETSADGTAWQLYTGALTNAGATLTLRDADGGIVDRIVGGENWDLLGGNNETKDTAQLINGVWRTAIGTPGVQPNTFTEEVIISTTAAPVSSKNPEAQKINGITSVLTLPDVTLQLAIDGPRTAYVNQPVTFTAIPSGVGSTIEQSLVYTWNFGEGNNSVGKEVNHSYSHPGNYVVVVEGMYKRQQQFARQEIVVLPVALSIVERTDGSVAIQNTSQTEIDIAGYRLVGDTTFLLPLHTILLPQSQIVIDRSRFSRTNNSQVVVLYDQANQSVSMHTPTILRTLPTQSDVTYRSSSAPLSDVSTISTNQKYRFAQSSEKNIPESTELIIESSAESVDRSVQIASVVTAAPALPLSWPHYVLVGILMLGVLSVYLVPRKDNGIPWI
jgi:hypothetical protein